MKPKSGLKFLLPMLSDQDVKVIERYVNERILKVLEDIYDSNWSSEIGQRIYILKQEAEGL